MIPPDRPLVWELPRTRRTYQKGRARMNRAVPCVCIADRNANVSVFLGRIFQGRGYETRVARNCGEVRNLFRDSEPPDLLIYDPETPCQDSASALSGLMADLPSLPVVLYTHGSDGLDLTILQRAAALVEKSPDPRALVRTVDHLIRRAYPGRFPENGRGED